MHVTALATYPVKSCRAVVAESFPVAATGMPFDRHFMVTDAHGGFVTQRNLPALARIQPRVEGAALVLEAAGDRLAIPAAGEGPPVAVSVWDQATEGLDMGDAAAAFLARHLGAYKGAPLRLRRIAPAAWRQALHPLAPAPAPVAFADSMPFLVVAEASLADLNQRLRAKGHAALPMNRFRANIVLAGMPAFGEHDVAGLRIGRDVELRMTKACTRCRITMTDQETGALGSEPLATLGEYRRDERQKIIFGHYAVLVRGEGATVRVGDPVEAL